MKDFDLYYDSLEECLESIEPIPISSWTTASEINTIQITTTAMTPNRATTTSPKSVKTLPPTTTSLAASKTSKPISSEEISNTKSTDDTKKEAADQTIIILLSMALPSFVTGAVVSGCVLIVYLKRRLMKKNAIALKKRICGIRRKKRTTPKTTIEEQPKIEEDLTPKTPLQTKIEINEDPTPKRSNIKRILDGWRKSDSPKRVPQRKTTKFTMFDDFKEEQSSQPALKQSPKSSLDSPIINQSISPNSNVIDLEEGCNLSDLLKSSPESNERTNTPTSDHELEPRSANDIGRMLDNTTLMISNIQENLQRHSPGNEGFSTAEVETKKEAGNEIEEDQQRKKNHEIQADVKIEAIDSQDDESDGFDNDEDETDQNPNTAFIETESQENSDDQNNQNESETPVHYTVAHTPRKTTISRMRDEAAAFLGENFNLFGRRNQDKKKEEEK